MYILEVNHINNKEDLFFPDTNLVSVQETDEFFKNAKQKHIHNFVENKFQSSNTRFKREDGSYQRVGKIYFFKTIEAAEDYFKEVIADGSNYRKIRRAWHQEHKIINETNILDASGNVVKVIHSCQGNTCLRFGTCPTISGGGCEIVSEKTEIPVTYHKQINWRRV